MKIYSPRIQHPHLSMLVLLVSAVEATKWLTLLLSLDLIKRCLLNSTGKDIPKNVEEDHVVLIPDSDGIGKNVEYGKEVLSQNGAIVEDALRIKLGKVDWLFVLAGGGGGTGSSVTALHPVFERYMRSVQSSGKVVYVVSWPTAQENLNPTIARNALTLANDVAQHPHIILDNERATRLLARQNRYAWHVSCRQHTIC